LKPAERHGRLVLRYLFFANMLLTFLLTAGLWQDKSSCIGVHTLRMLMNEGDDVIHVNVGAGITTAHIASLANSPDMTVYAFGVQSDLQRQQIIHNLERFGCRCIFIVIVDGLC